MLQLQQILSTDHRYFLQDEYTQFKPRFMVQRCLDRQDSLSCQENCINRGRYCAMDHIDEDLQGSYKGRHVSDLARNPLNSQHDCAECV